MLTKAIVEEVLSPYAIRVRVPRTDRVMESSSHTSKENLTIASICTLPNCYMNVQVGDIVFVAYEDNTERKLVILGHLCREATQDTTPDITTGQLTVNGAFQATEDVKLGEISYRDIKCLKGIQDNIQQQLNILSDRLEDIEKLLQTT